MRVFPLHKNGTVSRSSRGFTLIELLVVISIIAVLMAVMIPALNKARDQAKKIICMSRLRGIGTAFGLYIADNKGSLPSSPWVANATQPSTGWEQDQLPWFAKLGPYFNRKGTENTGQGTLCDYKLLRCAKQDHWTKMAKEGDIATHGNTQKVGWEGIYGYNWFFTEDDTSGNLRPWSWRKHSNIKKTDNIPLLGDCNADDPLNQGKEGISGVRMSFSNPHPIALKYGWMNGDARSKRYDYSGPAANHNGKCAFLMADFHCETRDVCDPGMWPWLGDTPQEQQNGEAFHPLNNLRINP